MVARPVQGVMVNEAVRHWRGLKAGQLSLWRALARRGKLALAELVGQGR